RWCSLPTAARMTRTGHRRAPDRRLRLVDVQLLEQRERVVDRLEEVLVVLDHLAPHVHAEPLLVDVELVAIEHLPEAEVRLRGERRQEHRSLEAEGDRLKVRGADRRVSGEEDR